MYSVLTQLESGGQKIALKGFTQVRVERPCSDVLIDFSLTVKAATLIIISRRGSAISSAKPGQSGSIYNLVNNN